MIICLVSVGNHYNNKIKDALNFFKDFDVCILSDIKVENVFHYEEYVKKEFSYFDKLYFSLKMVEKFNRSVFYVDITKIEEINLDFPKESLFYYKSHWPFGNLMSD